MRPSIRRNRHRRQQGVVLFLLVLMVALVLIALAAEVPPMVAQLRRDREEELIRRGAQYARAIRLYYKKVGSYPVRLDQLENTNQIRFLRRRYKDPMTGKDFKILHNTDVQLSGQSQTTNLGSNASSTAGLNSPTTSDTRAQNSPSSTNSSPSSSSSGTTFGGGPIVGVASTSNKQSFHVFNKKDHYNEWQFFYDQSSNLTTGWWTLIKGPYDGAKQATGGAISGATQAGQTQSGTSSIFAQPQPSSPSSQNPPTNNSQ